MVHGQAKEGRKKKNEEKKKTCDRWQTSFSKEPTQMIRKLINSPFPLSLIYNYGHIWAIGF